MNVNIGNKNIANYLNKAQAAVDGLDKEIGLVEHETDLPIREKVDELMISAETIAFNFNEREQRIELYYKVANRAQTVYYNDETPDSYLEFCHGFGIDEKEEYNHSTWFMSEAGDLVRVFAVTAPVCKFPNVTLNISRAPQGVIDQKEVMPFVKKIVTSRFIIVGATGSGKTYFLNNALKIAFEGSQNRIALVEEFHELFPPNANTFMMDANPGKPGKPSVFDYVIQQTNLMRVQNIFVGEVKGKEAFPFVTNMASGTDGGCTMHGKSVEDGLNRLQMLMATAQIADRPACGEMIAHAVEYAIYIEKHRVMDIKRLTGVYNHQSGKFQMENLL